MRKADVLGYFYDNAEPAFAALEGGQYYYHLHTKKMLERSSFDTMLSDKGLAFEEGELGAPSAGWLAQHGGLTQNLFGPAKPTVPSSFAAVAADDTSIDLSWTDASDNEAGFRIDVSDAIDGTFVTIVDLAPGETSYTHTGLTAATAYFYEIYAFNVTGDSLTAAAANDTTDA